MSDDSAGRSGTLVRLVGVALATIATIAAVSIGVQVVPAMSGGETRTASSPQSETRLEVQPRPGECAHGSQGLISVPLEGDASRSPAEAFVRAQKMHPELGTLTPHPGDPNWGERIESGRRVAAAKAVEFPREGGGSAWVVMETAFTAACDYVNPAHLKASETVPEGVIPANPEEAAPADHGAPEAGGRT